MEYQEWQCKNISRPPWLLSEGTDKNCLIYNLERGMERMVTEKMQRLGTY